MSDRTVWTLTLVLVAGITIAIGWFTLKGGLGAPLAIMLSLPALFLGRHAYARMESA